MKPTKINRRNDRVKREYLVWLKEAKQRSPSTVDQARHAIDRLEVYTGFKDFGTFTKEQALGFKNSLVETKAQRSGKALSIVTVHHILQAVREFLVWLHGRSEYRRRIKLENIAYLNLTTGDERKAHVSVPKEYASWQEYRKALFAMPANTEMERRDRAIIALLLMTCMRDAALVSLKLRHISLDRSHVFQDPRQVRTKFSKPINTFFYPVGEDVFAIVREWVEYLIAEKGFGPDDPLFPKTMVMPNENQIFAPQGIGQEHWASAAPVRKIFHAAFERVGLPYVKPHTVRDTLTQLAYQLNLSVEQFKAWSQNMGHEKPLTTLNGYGHVSLERQAEIIGSLGDEQQPQPSASMDERMAKMIAEQVAALINPQKSGSDGDNGDEA